MLVRLSLRTAFPLPQSVSALAEALMLGFVPELVRAPIRLTRPFPQQISALANNLVQARFGLRQDAVRISEWGQLAAAADVHLGVQRFEFFVRHQLSVGRRFQSLICERMFLKRRL